MGVPATGRGSVVRQARLSPASAGFSAMGVPAVNFGPGDPMFAHKQDEHVPVEHGDAQLVGALAILMEELVEPGAFGKKTWLANGAVPTGFAPRMLVIV